jgi:hypothetical protein
MLVWTRLEYPFAPDSPFDVSPRHFAFLRQRMSQDRQIPSVKEVEYPVVYVAFSNPKFMDAVSQNVSEGPPQLMPEIGKPFNGGDAALVGLPVGSPKLLQPIEHWDVLWILLVEDDISPRHTASV